MLSPSPLFFLVLDAVLFNVENEVSETFLQPSLVIWWCSCPRFFQSWSSWLTEVSSYAWEPPSTLWLCESCWLVSHLRTYIPPHFFVIVYIVECDGLWGSFWGCFPKSIELVPFLLEWLAMWLFVHLCTWRGCHDHSAGLDFPFPFSQINVEIVDVDQLDQELFGRVGKTSDSLIANCRGFWLFSNWHSWCPQGHPLNWPFCNWDSWELLCPQGHLLRISFCLFQCSGRERISWGNETDGWNRNRSDESAGFYFALGGSASNLTLQKSIPRFLLLYCCLDRVAPRSYPFSSQQVLATSFIIA